MEKELRILDSDEDRKEVITEHSYVVYDFIKEHVSEKPYELVEVSVDMDMGLESILWKVHIKDVHSPGLAHGIGKGSLFEEALERAEMQLMKSKQGE